MKSLYDCFIAKDCDMIEINPLITTKAGKVMAADSKVTIDSNSKYRQKELEARIQQILMMLDQALRSLNEVFQSIFKTNSDHRDFNKKMISIHM